METQYPPWKAWDWWNLVKADIGHIDNRRRISKEIDKVSSGKTGHCRIRKVQFILQFYFFRWKVRNKSFTCSMILTEISDFSFWKRKRLLCIVRDRLQETQNIKLCLALCWLFDVKRFLPLWLVSWIPTSTDPGDNCQSNSNFIRLTQPQILSGRVLKQL